MKLLHVGQPSLCPASFWGYPKTTATGIVGAYGELVYLSTVLGGWIADRLLGMERTALYGYDKGDARCVGGFALFYLGINLGAFVGPLITGLLQSRVGFRYAFGAAAIGMALGWDSTSRSAATWVRIAARCRTRCRAVPLVGSPGRLPWWLPSWRCSQSPNF